MREKPGFLSFMQQSCYFPKPSAQPAFILSAFFPGKDKKTTVPKPATGPIHAALLSH